MEHPRSDVWPSSRTTQLLLLALLLALSTAVAVPAAIANTGLQVTGLDDPTVDAAGLAQALGGAGVTIDAASVTFTGEERAAGSFTGGDGIVGFDGGIILSSGQAVDVVGPNESPSTTTDYGGPGDTELTTLAGVDTFDAAILEFDFEVDADAEQVTFSYVFGSEEYNEFVTEPLTGVNDAFAFFVNDTNCALVPNPDDPADPYPVTITTVNNGQPGVDPVNPHLYINNDPFNADSTGETVAEADLLDTEMDGLTVVLTCEAAVTPGAVNTMKLAIADGGDSILDSWVLIRAGSLTTGPEPGVIAGTVTDAGTGGPIAGATVTADGQSTTTAADGTYSLTGLEPATYTVTASAAGYQSASQSAMVVAGETTTVDFALVAEVADPGEQCVALIANQHEVAGEVCVFNDGENLVVTYTTVDGWMLTETHLHVADDSAGLPQNKKGNPKVGNFDHSSAHDPAVTSHTYTISLASLGADVGDALALAAHAVVVREESEGTRVETAWGDGARFVQQGNWAMHFTYTVN